MNVEPWRSGSGVKSRISVVGNLALVFCFRVGYAEGEKAEKVKTRYC